VCRRIIRDMSLASCTRWYFPPRSQVLACFYAASVAEDLGFSVDYCNGDEFAQCMAGNQLLPGSQSFATRYGGHQFGTWAGQLGDGRAINLGEIATQSKGALSLQLKGAGPTPYSLLPTRAAPMVVPFCAHRCASFSAVKPCIFSEFPVRAR